MKRILSKVIDGWSKTSFSHFGVVGKPLPPHYIHRLQIKEYLESEYGKNDQVWIVGKEGCLGREWRYGPLHFELYYSDHEPTIIPTPYLRIILWQPLTKLEAPQGWRHLWFPAEIPRQIGFAHIKNTSYWTTWTKNAQRDRTIWLNNKEFEIVSSDYATFLKEYSHEKAYQPIRQITLNILKNKVDRFGTSIRFFAAQRKADKKIGAMVAFIELAHARTAFYLSAFVTQEAQKKLCSTGLIDHCFRFCVTHNIEFLDFGGFWTSGSPSSWKGFSRFKQKFGVTLLHYPPMFWRVVRKNQKE